MRPAPPTPPSGRPALLSLAALVLLATAGCGDSGTDAKPDGGSDEGSGSTPAATDVVEGLSVTGDFGKKPTVKVDGLDVDAVQSSVVIEGDGAEVTEKSSVKYRFYVGNGTTGKEIQSNYAENEPATLALGGISEKIRGEIIGKSIGDRVAVAMPVTDLFGKEGSPEQGLKPTEDLVLVFDLLEEAEAPLDGPQGTAVDPPADAPQVVEEDGKVVGVDFSAAPKQPPTELQVIPLIEGEGAKLKKSDQIVADYLGVVWGAKQPFDDSYSRGEPLNLPLGNLVKGWGQGLEGVSVGSRVLLVIPPELGYGGQEQEGIPADSTLVFVVDVLGANL